MLEEAFLAAIYAAPDDDCARLVFADWLDENGQSARAAFIRLHCQLERDQPTRVNDDDRLYDVVEQYGTQWTSHLPQVADVTWQFRRGLPEGVEIGLPDLLHGYQLWSTLPRLRYLALHDCTDYGVIALAQQTWSVGWISLQLFEDVKPWVHSYPHDPTPGIAALVNHPQATQLRELAFMAYYLPDTAIHSLVQSPQLAGLRRLVVQRGYTTDPRLSERFGSKLTEGGW